MFRPSYSPFSLNSDLNMWDTKSHFSAQTSAWCGTATVSGTGFLSKVNTSTSGSIGGFGQNDPGLRKWQSLSYLAPEGATRPFPPAPGAELRQAEGMQWLQDAHKRLDSQLDRLRTGNSQLSYNINNTQLLGMKHKLSEMIDAIEQEKETAASSEFEKSRKRGELHERVLQLERDLLQMRSSLDRGSNDQPTERTLPLNKEGINRQTQTSLLNQTEEMNQRRQNHSEVQEQLSDANNKISQACLEKAILSTQVLMMEDNIKELKAKLTEALSDRDRLIKEKADLHQRAQPSSEGCDTESHNNKQETVLMTEELKALREVNVKLKHELEMIQLKLKTSWSQLQEVTAERDTNSKQITDLEAERSQLIREKEELLSQINKGGHEELMKMKEKACQLREYVENLEIEKQNMQERCRCLEAEVFEEEEKFHLQEEEHRKQDAVRDQSINELRAVASHWAEKWQKVALILQSTQEELEELKRNNSRSELQADAAHLAAEIEKLKKEEQKDKEEIKKLLQHKADMETILTRAKKESNLVLVELESCKQELELERSRTLFNTYKNKGAASSLQIEDTETQTDLSESSLLWEPPSDAHSSQNKAPQASEHDQDDAGQANVSTTDSLRTQLEENRKRENQLLQDGPPAVQKLQTLKKIYLVNDEGRKDKLVSPVDPEGDQQRRMVTEQLKSLFKEREGKEVGKVDNRAAAGQTGAFSVQDWSQTSKVVRNTVDRRSWQQGSGLMPVFEEDEESSDGPGREGAEEASSDENNYQNQQMSATSTEICSLKENNGNLLQGSLMCKQPIQHNSPTAKRLSDKSSRSPDENDLHQKRSTSLYPDGIFLAELVDICSPDEDEEEGQMFFYKD